MENIKNKKLQSHGHHRNQNHKNTNETRNVAKRRTGRPRRKSNTGDKKRKRKDFGGNESNGKKIKKTTKIEKRVFLDEEEEKLTALTEQMPF